MSRAIEGMIQELLQVPPEPEPPVGGEPGALKIFRAARSFYHYRVLSWILKQLSVFSGVFVGIFFFSGLEGELRRLFLGMEVLALVVAVIYLPISFFMVSLDFKYRWYMVTDRSLRVREGIFKVQERTMTFSNIQNVAIRQGPLQRFFGIADVEVRTAGGGGGGGGGQQEDAFAENMHIGYFRGVDNAEEIRDLIMNHLRRLSATGLGDPDEVMEPSPSDGDLTAEAGASDPVAASTGPTDAVLVAARDLLHEVRALRFEGSRPMAGG